MAGQGVVVINGRQWTVSIATTFTELTQGLSGISSIPAGSGMLFDMGSELGRIDVYTGQMLFNMDVVFIGAQNGVVGRCLNIAPGESCVFESSTRGARYFLEVNAGEAADVEVRDNVDISGTVEPQFWATVGTIVVAVLILGGISKLAGRAAK